MCNQCIAALDRDEFILEREGSIKFGSSTTNNLKPAMKWKVFFDWFFSVKEASARDRGDTPASSRSGASPETTSTNNIVTRVSITASITLTARLPNSNTLRR